MIKKVLKIALFVLLFVGILLIPPFLKIFYQFYSEILMNIFPTEVTLENDTYYFSIVTALTNTLIVGSLSYEINNFNKKAKLYEQYIEYSQYYNDIINSVKDIVTYNRASIIFEPKILSSKIPILIKSTNLKIKNKEKLVKLVTEINKIHRLKKDNNETLMDRTKSFVFEFCDEYNLNKELDNDLKTIFYINGKE